MRNFAILTTIFVLVSSCATRKDIEQEQKLTTIDSRLNDNKKLQSDVMARLQTLEEMSTGVTGKIETSNHETKTQLQQEINQLKERVILMEEINKNTEDQLKKVNTQLKEQKAYLDKVLAALSKVGGTPKKAKKGKKKRSTYDQAMHDYKRARYKSAKKLLLELEDSKKIKGNRKARIYHNLGMIHYMDKKYDTALVYFSKLLTNYPKAPYNQNGMFYLAKTFQENKQIDEAKETLNQLIAKYPKWKNIKKAKNLLKKL